MTIKHTSWWVGGLLLLAGLASLADVIQTTEFAITATPDARETTPSVGADAIGEIVVYTSHANLPTGGVFPGAIMYQRIDKSGAPVGAPVQVSDGTTDDQFKDISAGRIVYTARESTGSPSSNIMLWDTATETTIALTPAVVEVGEVRIDGDLVVWVQGPRGLPGTPTRPEIPAAQEIMYLDLNWPTGTAAVSIAGPTPSAAGVEIGDAYIVWHEGPWWKQGDIWVLNRRSGSDFAVEFDGRKNAHSPTTAGAWAQRDILIGANSIQARNALTGENRIVANNGSAALLPAMDGDYVAYASNAAGNFDTYLYRISGGDNHQVTTSPW